MAERLKWDYEGRVIERMAEMDRLVASLGQALDRVSDLHTPTPDGYCEEDGFSWPCRTRQALGVHDRQREGEGE